MDCEVCGKPDQDKEENHCYGCGHIICTDCCHDHEYDDLIGSPHNIQTHRRVFSKKMRENSKTVATTSMIAGLYIILGFGLQSIAFGSIQVRFADALYPLIAVLGLPCLLGTFLGHLIFNIYGFGVGIALGLGDLASPVIFLIPKFAIHKWKLKAVPLHIIFIAFWVSWLLYTLFNIPFWVSVLTVGVGEFIAEIMLGIPLTLAIKRRIR